MTTEETKPDRNAAIIKRRAEGATIRQIAEEFGIGHARVSVILTKAKRRAISKAEKDAGE